MPLEDIIQKEQTIYTPLAQEVADAPEEQERKFQFHVATYVAIADMKNRWNASVDNLLKGRSATGLIYADTGYGKTSTGASLWHYAESKGLVAVPPFRWGSLADLLTATHGWVRYRLQYRRQDLISDLEAKYASVVSVGEESLAQRMSLEKRMSVEQAHEAISHLKAEGRFRDELSPHELLEYLRFATQQVLTAGYKGLLILPDEFQLFKNNPNSAQNLDRLKGFIFGIHGEEKLPIGCVALTYNETFAIIRETESNYMLARFCKPAGNIINLETLYGETEFARHLWSKLANLCNLSTAECQAVDDDVLDAMGQFLRHSRARTLMSGPRSVVETFKHAALHYTEKNRPYSLFDFCEDYLAGNIAFSSQHTEAAQAHTRIMALPSVNTPEKRKIVKLLCVHPEGVPPELFQKYGISGSDRDNIVQSLLGVHVITKGTSTPTLTCYRDDLLGVDSLNEVLKRLRERFNPENKTVHHNSVRAFHKHVFTQIFTPRKQGALLGWTGMPDLSENWNGECTMNLTGAPPNLREYPNRILKVSINTQKVASPSLTTESQLQVQFILDTTGDVINSCHVTTNGLEFRFNLRKPINPQKVPEDIGKLAELFLPENITPLLLLSILDFFDEESTIVIVKGAKQEAQVHFLTDRIRDELIRYFFSPEVKENTVGHSADLASVPAGKGFVEAALKVLIPKQFPNYHAVAIAKGWENDLGKYRDAFSKGYSLGVKRGVESIKGGSKLFNIGQVAFDNLSTGVARDLLRVEHGSSRRDDPDIYFILHPFEELLVERLENSRHTILIDGKPIKATELSKVYHDAKNLGYLDEEVDALLAILKARGIADQQQVSGVEYIYLVETSINFADLKTKLDGIEAIVTFAKANGFQYECNDLSAAHVLTGTLGIEDDEMQKDKLRQNLNSAETHLNNKCAEWLKTEHEKLRQKIHDLATLHLQVPPVLEQQTGLPIEFSRILFRDVQSKVKSAYTKISDRIRKIQVKIRETCDREVVTYQSDQTPRKAIEIALRLRKACSDVDTDIKVLNQEQKDAQELYRLFKFWRMLAHQIDGDGQLMDNSQKDSVMQNLIMQFDVVEKKIADHLGNKRIPLKDVLGSHEHFKTQIDEINAEFTQFLTRKKDTFIVYQTKIMEQLKPLPGQPPQTVDFNPVESEGCYRKVREEAVGKLRFVISEVLSENKNRQRELLKPIEVFKVPESIRTKAIQLRRNLEKLAEEFQRIPLKFTVEKVDQNLSNWVNEIISGLEQGQTISETRKQIERELDALVPDPGSKAQKLQDELAAQQETDFTELIVRLLGDGTFSSATEILESLEELYQANLVNLTVHRK